MAKQIPLLKAEDIEVKVKQVTAKGAIALLYKTARTDMAILDNVFGALNWESDYKEIKGNLYCGIGVRENENSLFVWKWDCGIESRGDDEGNEKKGEASDAFKRAGFKWGIGRELYTAPFIFITAETEQDGKKFKLKDRYARYVLQSIEYDDNRNIIGLTIIDNSGEIVYSYPKKKATAKKLKQELPFPEVEQPAIICEFCEKEIKRFKSMTAQKLAEYTQNKYGNKLCAACADDLSKKLNAEDNNVG